VLKITCNGLSRRGSLDDLKVLINIITLSVWLIYKNDLSIINSRINSTSIIT